MTLCSSALVHDFFHSVFDTLIDQLLNLVLFLLVNSSRHLRYVGSQLLDFESEGLDRVHCRFEMVRLVRAGLIRRRVFALHARRPPAFKLTLHFVSASCFDRLLVLVRLQLFL